MVFTTKTIVAQLKEIFGPAVGTKLKEMAQIMRLKQPQSTITKLSTELSQLALPQDAEKALGVDDETLTKASTQRQEASHGKSSPQP